MRVAALNILTLLGIISACDRAPAPAPAPERRVEPAPVRSVVPAPERSAIAGPASGQSLATVVFEVRERGFVVELPGGWQRQPADPDGIEQFSSADGTTALTVNSARVTKQTTPEERCELGRAVAETHRNTERKLIGPDVSTREPTVASVAGACSVRYAGFSPSRAHRFATLVLVTDAWMWSTFLESSTLEAEAFRELTEAVHARFQPAK